MCEPRQQYGGNVEGRQELVLGKGGGPGRQVGTRYGLSEIVDVSEGGTPNKIVRIYPDGIRVGCTFITKEAVAHVLAMAKECWGEIG